VRKSVRLLERLLDLADVEPARQCRQLVDDRLWLGLGDGLGDGARVERVGDYRLSAELAHQLALRIAARHAGDLVSTVDELRHQRLSNYSGRARYQDPHDVLLWSSRSHTPGGRNRPTPTLCRHGSHAEDRTTL
jgi:hypothetical protein